MLDKKKTINFPKNKWAAFRRGARLTCPQCGETALFKAYLKPVNALSPIGLPYPSWLRSRRAFVFWPSPLSKGSLWLLCGGTKWKKNRTLKTLDAWLTSLHITSTHKDRVKDRPFDPGATQMVPNPAAKAGRWDNGLFRILFSENCCWLG